MKVSSILLASSIIFFSSITHAGGMGADDSEPCWDSESCVRPAPPEAPNYSWMGFGTLSVGPGISTNGQTQTFALQPDITNTYSAHSTRSTVAVVRLFLGKQKQLSSNMYTQVGLGAGFGSNIKLNGDIWEDANPNFNNFTYKYQVNEARITLKGKFLVEVDSYGTRPFISADMGAGFNHAYNFSITPKISEEIAPSPFKGNTEYAFTYAFGLGVDQVLNRHWIAGINYEFANWGKSELTRAAGQTLNTGLVLDHIYVNSILVSLTYLT